MEAPPGLVAKAISTARLVTHAQWTQSAGEREWLHVTCLRALAKYVKHPTVPMPAARMASRSIELIGQCLVV